MQHSNALETLNRENKFRSLINYRSAYECWPWLGDVSNSGYGRFFDRRRHQAHRYSYRYYWGLIPSDKIVMHICDNRICVNPWHLKLGSMKENSHDMLLKKRWSGGRPPASHCLKGHEFTEQNTRIGKMKYSSTFGDQKVYVARFCRACDRDASKRKRIKQKSLMYNQSTDKT